MRNALVRLWRARGGNVALLTALLALPLVGLTGLAIDFGNATLARARLDAASDSAALLATTVASNQSLAGVLNPTVTAQTAALQRFKAEAASQPNVVIGPVAVSVSVSGALFTSKVTYQGAYQTYFGSLFGVAEIALGGGSASSLSLNPFVDIHVLMDVSSSMTIAATQSDINAMQALTAAYVPTGPVPGNVAVGEACAFACHWSTAGNDFLALARNNGVTLRLDVLRSAVGNLITNTSQPSTNRGRFGSASRLSMRLSPSSTRRTPTSALPRMRWRRLLRTLTIAAIIAPRRMLVRQ